MNNLSNKIVSITAKIAFVAAVISSTAYLLMLGWYNNLLLDDYGMVADVDVGGAYGLMKGAYFGWQSRFSAFYVLGCIFKIFGHVSNLIGYTILLLVLGYGTLYYALKNITRLTNKWLLFGSAILITNVSIMAYFEMSTFYWVCCAVYTLSTYAAIALFTAIFFNNGTLWTRWLIVVLCSLYISGGAENFTPVVIATLGLVLLYQMISNRTWRFGTNPQQQMIVASLMILCVGFLAVLLGPGTHNREASMSGFAGNFAIIPYFVKLASALAVFTMRLLSRSLYYILLLPIGFIIGKNMKYSTQYSNWKLILLSLGVVLGVIVLSVAASVYGMGWYSPLRSYSFVSFVLAAWFIYLGSVFGSRFSLLTIDILVSLSSCLIVAYSLYYYRQEKPLVKNYHEQIVRRHEVIIDAIENNRKEVVVIKKIEYLHVPNTYALLRKVVNVVSNKTDAKISAPNEYFPYERYVLSCNPNDFRNKGVQRYYQATFDIIGCENPN